MSGADRRIERPAIIVGEGKIDALDVRFHDCDVGWIHVGLAPLDHDWCARCTHLADPFPAMIDWLESIADGVDCATWHIAEEGPGTHFTFLARRGGGLGGAAPMLLQTRSDAGIDRIAGWAVEAETVIRAFYTGFRAFVESDAYRPEEWEWSGMREEDIPDDVSEEEYDRLLRWDGHNLGKLRSPRIEAMLAAIGKPDAQGSLI